MKTKHIILVPETHWDREWYLPFQEFRAKLVIMMDKLLTILKTDPEYKNFTFDGQTIPLEDYLEIRPEKEEEIKKYVKNGRLSIGPMYILPDEFLVSGESLIRNLIIGHKLAKNFGRVMKAGYIPDPFGHIAQLPQILRGFEVPSVLFWRGFGNEFEQQNLDMEFIWNAPGNAASILGVHLISSYGSLANISTTKRNGKYKRALRKINRVVSKLENFSATPYILLNNGSDHDEAQPEIPEIVAQWNEENPENLLEQRDFEYYTDKVLEYTSQLKDFQGELRGGRYAHLLSGVFSARMWIKQRNTEIEYLYQNYTEPLSTMTWILDKTGEFNYPYNYILTGLKWLIKNHPHDSICGCSIDQVHKEMKTRFDWAEQIGNEIIKNCVRSLSNRINSLYKNDDLIPFIVYNPLPWKRKDLVAFTGITPSKGEVDFPSEFKLIDHQGKEIAYQGYLIEEVPRHDQESNISKKFTFLTEVPACGYKVYYLNPNEDSATTYTHNKEMGSESDEFSIENEFYKIKVDNKGIINVLDKKDGGWYEKVCFFEDTGDWGDEYDFSGPDKTQEDTTFTSENATIIEKSKLCDGPTQQKINLKANLKLPSSLTGDRKERENILKNNYIEITISLLKGIKRIDFRIEVVNKSKDHRLRVLFPSKVKSDKIYADGHFYVVPRQIELPEADNWAQKPLPTNHQKDFVSVSDNKTFFSVINRGLPEYEAIRKKDDTITFAITLIRSIEWLSRADFKTRNSHAGPKLRTPGAQCIGKHTFELSLIIDEGNSNWFDANIHQKGKEFNNPLLPLFPSMITSDLGLMDKVILNPTGILSLYVDSSKPNKETFLPPSLSFMEIDNNAIFLSALKKAENGDNLVFRVYNISDKKQHATVKFFKGIELKSVSIVNFLEQKSEHRIKAEVIKTSENQIELTLDPHVITTLKANFTIFHARRHTPLGV